MARSTITNRHVDYFKENIMENKELKGVFKGNCNRTACQKPGAMWYNLQLDFTIVLNVLI